jgi:hypothetical protein
MVEQPVQMISVSCKTQHDAVTGECVSGSVIPSISSNPQMPARGAGRGSTSRSPRPTKQNALHLGSDSKTMLISRIRDSRASGPPNGFDVGPTSKRPQPT